MTTVLDILDQLSQTGSRLDKEEILELNSKNYLLRLIIVTTLDPYTTFNVVKIKPNRHAVVRIHDDDTIMKSFMGLLTVHLATRKLTGNAAKEAVLEHIHMMDARQQEWARRILLRNLRIGVQEKTANKVWPGSIKPFAVQLAATLRVKDGVTTPDIKYPVFVEPKLDGLRVIAIKKDGKCTIWTRNGNELSTLPSIAAAVEACRFDNFVLDGECCGEDWSQTDSVLTSTKRKKDDSVITYHVFDAMLFVDWTTQITHEFSYRKTYVKNYVDAINDSCVALVESQLVNSQEELFIAYKKYCDGWFEGMMIKDPNAQYSFGRSSAIMKLKPVETIEGIIKDFFLAGVGTKREGTFGGFWVEVKPGVLTRVGSGMSDKFKAEVQLNGAHTYVGQIIECKFQANVDTEDGLTEDGKMLFPRMVRIRDRRDVDISRLPGI